MIEYYEKHEKDKNDVVLEGPFVKIDGGLKSSLDSAGKAFENVAHAMKPAIKGFMSVVDTIQGIIDFSKMNFNFCWIFLMILENLLQKR